MGYAFISYSHVQESSASALKDILNANGIRTWMAPEDIPAGSSYASEIIRAIRECSCFILLLTRDSMNSQMVERELERAVHYDKTIFPVKLEDVVLNDQFEFFLSTNQFIAMDKTDSRSGEMSRLLSVVAGCTGTPPKRKPAAVEAGSSTACASTSGGFAQYYTVKKAAGSPAGTAKSGGFAQYYTARKEAASPTSAAKGYGSAKPYAPTVENPYARYVAHDDEDARYTATFKPVQSKAAPRPISPEALIHEIEIKKFGIQRNGYSREEVDIYLDDLCDQLESPDRKKLITERSKELLVKTFSTEDKGYSIKEVCDYLFEIAKKLDSITGM